MRLAAGTCASSRHNHIAIVTECAAERVARQRSCRTFLPRHDHPRIEPTRQRHPDSLTAFEITLQVAGKYGLKLFVVRLWFERGLFLPFRWLEIDALCDRSTL